MRIALVQSLLALLLIAACSPAPAAPASETQLTVLAAASLASPFKEMGAAFQAAHPGTAVNFSFAGSQQLRSQIEQGAPADVFASADTANMQPLEASGLLAGQPQIFARNRLVVILPKSNPGRVTQLGDLARPGLKVVVADPSVPVGSYTLQVLDKLSADPSFGPTFKKAVLARVVSQETNVSQVVSKVALGEADAGIAYVTDGRTFDRLLTIDIPDRFNVVATYPIAVLKNSKSASLAQAFEALVLSAQGQGILARYGFMPR